MRAVLVPVIRTVEILESFDLLRGQGRLVAQRQTSQPDPDQLEDALMIAASFGALGRQGGGEELGGFDGCGAEVA